MTVIQVFDCFRLLISNHDFSEIVAKSEGSEVVDIGTLGTGPSDIGISLQNE